MIITPVLLTRLRTLWWLRKCVSVGSGTLAAGPVRYRREGRLRVGSRVLFDARVAPIEIFTAPGAEVEIGDDVVVESGVIIWSLLSIRIGAKARLGAFSAVMDNHGHDLDASRSVDKRPSSKPVVIETGAVVGPKAIVLPGAWLGEGAILGPAAVLARRVNPGSHMRGSPLQSIPNSGMGK